MGGLDPSFFRLTQPVDCGGPETPPPPPQAALSPRYFWCDTTLAHSSMSGHLLRPCWQGWGVNCQRVCGRLPSPAPLNDRPKEDFDPPSSHLGGEAFRKVLKKAQTPLTKGPSKKHLPASSFKTKRRQKCHFIYFIFVLF